MVNVSGACPVSGVTVSHPGGVETAWVTVSGSELEAAGSETVTFAGAGMAPFT
jgi:hypothetical protein